MNIVIGLYNEYFFEQRNIHNWEDFPFPSVKYNKPKYKSVYSYSYVLGIVYSAAICANSINIIMDGIIPSTNGWTAKEINLIINSPEFLSKTIFWLEGKIISQETALSLIQRKNYVYYKI